MSSPKKKTSAVRRKYTTREIMEITEKRRMEQDAAAHKNVKPESKVPENAMAPESPPEPENPPVTVGPLNTQLPVSRIQIIPTKLIAVSLAYILTLIVLLMLFSKLSGGGVNAVMIQLNKLIVYGSFLILNVVQGPCIANGVFLNTPYYSLSLQGDWVAFYCIELLVIFALLFAFFQKITRIKRGVVYVALIPLAIIANIFRVVMACGMAMNDGPAYAEKCFHGILAGAVFLIITLGLVLLEYLSSPE